jgi:hypothetical protein
VKKADAKKWSRGGKKVFDRELDKLRDLILLQQNTQSR